MSDGNQSTARTDEQFLDIVEQVEGRIETEPKIAENPARDANLI